MAQVDQPYQYEEQRSAEPVFPPNPPRGPAPAYVSLSVGLVINVSVGKGI
jgi:hypothetical protein